MIVCGWCHASTESERCRSCGRDPVLPWTQRATEPPSANEPRRRLAEAARVLGREATIDQIAEHFDVSPRTVRRWREMSGA